MKIFIKWYNKSYSLEKEADYTVDETLTPSLLAQPWGHITSQVEAGLVSGLPRAVDRHGHGQASILGRRDDRQGAPPPTLQPPRHPTARRAPTTTRWPDLSRPQTTTLYYADADT